MTENDTIFVATWCARLAKSGEGLDLANMDDRSTFRMRVSFAMKNLKWSGMETVAKALCVEDVPRSRDGAVRAITTAWMDKLNKMEVF